MLLLAAADYIAGLASVASKLVITVFGMELNGSTEVYKVLYQGYIANSGTAIYTAPASNTAFIRSITIVNTDTATRTFQLYRGGTTAQYAITGVVSLVPNGSAVYEDGLGWQFFNAGGQLLLGTGDLPTGTCPNFGPTGVLAESIDRVVCPEVNATIPTASGTLFMQAIYLPAGIVVNNILWSSATTAAGTPTNNILGLYDINRNLLAQTANQLNAAWTANTMKTLAVTVPYVVPSSGLYYIGFMMTATTIITSKGGTAKTGGQLAAQAPILHGISTTGLTTSLPNPAAAITGGLVSAWCAVS